MMKKLAYTCTILPTLIWGMLMGTNLDENLLVITLIGITIISIIGIITTAIMVKREGKTTAIICLVYNLMITYTLIGGLLYTGAIKI